MSITDNAGGPAAGAGQSRPRVAEIARVRHDGHALRNCRASAIAVTDDRRGCPFSPGATCPPLLRTPSAAIAIASNQH
jgi:hypothetical protein